MNKDILEILEDRDAALFISLKTIRTNATSLLNQIPVLFSEYTDHSINHSDEVINNLNKLISDKLKEQLVPQEIYILICGAYLHDIGMVYFPELINGHFKENYDDFVLEKKMKYDMSISDNDILKEFIRDNHHLISEEYINNNFKDLGIDHKFAFFIGRVCRGHRRSDLSDFNTFPYKMGVDEESINLPLLCAFLEIADELDITYKRTPLILWNTLRPLHKISQIEWIKHLYIDSFHYDPDDFTHILISAKFRADIGEIPPEIKYAIFVSLLMLQDKMREKLRNTPSYLHKLKGNGNEVLIPKMTSVMIDGLYIEDYIKKNVPGEFSRYII